MNKDQNYRKNCAISRAEKKQRRASEDCIMGREKGRVGEEEAKTVLISNGWKILADTSAGVSAGDLLVESPKGIIYSAEIKNQKYICPVKYRSQALTNAKKIKKQWLVMAKIEGFSCWLVMTKNKRVWLWPETKE